MALLAYSRGFWYSASMVVRMRHTRAHTANRRSHHALKAQSLNTCECGAVRVSHRACPSCGRYNGRVAVDHTAKAAKVGNKSEVQK
jgi:large subunit ribosomal protein L32